MKIYFLYNFDPVVCLSIKVSFKNQDPNSMHLKYFLKESFYWVKVPQLQLHAVIIATSLCSSSPYFIISCYSSPLCSDHSMAATSSCDGSSDFCNHRVITSSFLLNNHLLVWFYRFCSGIDITYAEKLLSHKNV